MKKWIALALPMMFTMTTPSICASDADSSKADKEQTTTPAIEEIVTFIELGSVKCTPCQMMRMIMKEIKQEYDGEVNVVFYDVRTKVGRPIAEKYGIRMIPTQVFLDKEGKEFFRHEGYFPKEDIIKLLKAKGVGR